MRVYWDCFKPQMKRFVLDLLCLIADLSMELSLPYLMSLVMKRGVEAQNLQAVFFYGGLMALLALAAMVFGIFAMKLSALISNGFVYELRKRIFHRLQEFSFTNIDHFEVPSLITRITGDVNSFRIVVMMITRVGLKAPLTIAIASAFMFTMNAGLAAVVLAIAVVLCGVIVFLIVHATPLFRRMQVRLDGVNRAVEEDVDGIRVVKSFVREKHESGRFAGVNRRLKETAAKANKAVAMNMPIILFALNMATAFIIYFGGKDIIAGRFDSTELFSFVNYSIMILMSLNMISNLIMNLARCGASKERIDAVFAEKIDLAPEPSGSKGDHGQLKDGAVRFKNLSFSYCGSEDKLALSHIDLTIESGETVGIVGSTGSGKSSLISLIPRLYDATSGQVEVGGQDVRAYDLKDLRSQIGVVTQKNVLFSGTIRDNVLWGKKDATDEEIEDALKVSGADFVYSFPSGLETEVSQGGTSLSGGQKQRLTIARALIKKPKILILDDATSAVDVLTERNIRENLRLKHGAMTVLIIAQRITSVMDADRIVVLDEGKIEAVGTHSELLETSKVYREIYESQRRSV